MVGVWWGRCAGARAGWVLKKVAGLFLTGRDAPKGALAQDRGSLPNFFLCAGATPAGPMRLAPCAFVFVGPSGGGAAM